jgi:hypothetical protein
MPMLRFIDINLRDKWPLTSPNQFHIMLLKVYRYFVHYVDDITLICWGEQKVLECWIGPGVPVNWARPRRHAQPQDTCRPLQTTSLSYLAQSINPHFDGRLILCPSVRPSSSLPLCSFLPVFLSFCAYFCYCLPCCLFFCPSVCLFLPLRLSFSAPPSVLLPVRLSFHASPSVLFCPYVCSFLLLRLSFCNPLSLLFCFLSVFRSLRLSFRTYSKSVLLPLCVLLPLFWTLNFWCCYKTVYPGTPAP